jgi:hypothetical protein
MKQELLGSLESLTWIIKHSNISLSLFLKTLYKKKALAFLCIVSTSKVTNFFQPYKSCNYRIFPDLKDGTIRLVLAKDDPCPTCKNKKILVRWLKHQENVVDMDNLLWKSLCLNLKNALSITLGHYVCKQIPTKIELQRSESYWYKIRLWDKSPGF